MAADVVSVRLSESDKARLDELASQTGSSRSALVAEAVRGYLDVNQYQIDLIRERITLADQGEFASRERVKAAFARWGVDIDAD
ncbi:MAG: ribbon-helix-helix protein, CopG family [Pseudomonadota bacterium]|nr:ribbon-helix-helix protein, CopG family [Pseudomonadota bacterium]MDP1905469.1 ribbon-helix-helix protein, CopG family [Pseudomonadota bacterium]MDP2351078.1 ribbon-helix-helix protein, CopG family [Pseudomonadota bacterium]